MINLISTCLETTTCSNLSEWYTPDFQKNKFQKHERDSYTTTIIDHTYNKKWLFANREYIKGLH